MRPFLTVLALSLTAPTFAAANAVETCLFEEVDWTATLEACSAALATSDDPVEQGRFILHRGLAQEELGDLEAARLDHLLAAQYRPDWATPYLNASSLSELLGDPASELRWAEAAINAEPDNPNAYSAILYIRNNSDDPASCAPVAEQVIENLFAPIDWPFAAAARPHLMGNLGYCLETMNRPEEALQAYLAADYMGLDEQWLYANLAYLSFYTLEQDTRAIEAATRALAYDTPPSIETVYILVMAHALLGQFDEAVAAAETYAELLDAEDQSYGTRNELAWRLLDTGALEAAQSLMDQWVAAGGPDTGDPDSTIANTWDTVAHIRAAQGDAEGALEAFTAALERDTEDMIGLRRQTYRAAMEALGIAVGDGLEGLVAGLAECTQMGAACRLVYLDGEAPDE